MEEYVKYIRYILLPSFNIYKIESYALLNKINNLITYNTVAIKIINNTNSTFIVNKKLLNFMIENLSENVPEIIMEMKKHKM